MFCKQCGAAIPDSCAFCLSCGTRIVPAQPVGTAQQASANPYMASADRCPHCGGTFRPNAKFCSICGRPTGAAPAKKKRKLPAFLRGSKPSRRVKAVLLSVLAVLVILLTVGFATNWFGLYGPGAQILNATRKTLTAKSFTVEIDMTRKYAYYDSYYDEYTTRSREITGTIYVTIDADNEDLTLYGELEVDGEDGVIAIYDGFAISGPDGDYSAEDISDELDQFFDMYNNLSEGDLDPETLIGELLGEGTWEYLQDYADFDELEDCLIDYARCLNSSSWLKENAGYSTKHTDGMKVHTFDIDFYDFLKATLSEFKSVFADRDDYDDLEDSLDASEDYFDDVDFEVAFGIKGGKLRLLELDVATDEDTYDTEFHIALEFSDINKTDIDEGELRDLLDDADFY